MSRARGAEAEHEAVQFLQAQGLTLREMNYQCRFGEIDLVMQDGMSLIFVEVKARGQNNFGGVLESISPQKQRRLVATAKHYLSRLSTLPACRFDAILYTAEQKQPIWLKNIITG